MLSLGQWHNSSILRGWMSARLWYLHWQYTTHLHILILLQLRHSYFNYLARLLRR